MIFRGIFKSVLIFATVKWFGFSVIQDFCQNKCECRPQKNNNTYLYWLPIFKVGFVLVQAQTQNHEDRGPPIHFVQQLKDLQWLPLMC